MNGIMAAQVGWTSGAVNRTCAYRVIPCNSMCHTGAGFRVAGRYGQPAGLCFKLRELGGGGWREIGLRAAACLESSPFLLRWSVAERSDFQAAIFFNNSRGFRKSPIDLLQRSTLLRPFVTFCADTTEILPHEIQARSNELVLQIFVSKIEIQSSISLKRRNR